MGTYRSAVDGAYRVVTGDDGTRYLYLFPPDKGRHLAIVLSDDEVCILTRTETGPSFHAATFGRMLDELEAADQSERPDDT